MPMLTTVRIRSPVCPRPVAAAHPVGEVAPSGRAPRARRRRRPARRRRACASRGIAQRDVQHGAVLGGVDVLAARTSRRCARAARPARPGRPAARSSRRSAGSWSSRGTGRRPRRSASCRGRGPRRTARAGARSPISAWCSASASHSGVSSMRTRQLLDPSAAFSAWPPNSLRMADSTLSANSALPREREPLVQRGGEHVGGHALVDRRQHRPAALARVGHAAAERRTARDPRAAPWR